MSFPSVRRRGVLSGAVLTLLLSTNLPAQQQPRSLTMGEALARTAAQDPELVILDFEVEAAADAHPLRIEIERLTVTALSGNAIS